MDLVRTKGAGRAQRGFTIIELMIVVAIIAILAAVVIPGFFKESSKAKHQTEVNGMFSELTVKLEQWKIENGVYMGTTASPVTTLGPCPASPSSAGADFRTTCVTGGSTWESLRIAPPNITLFCTYAIEADVAANPPSPPAGFTMSTPGTSWWFVVATCDMDGQGGTNATFFVSSMDPRIQSQNVGQ